MLKDALKARRFYPNAQRRSCAVQAVAYAKAVEYLRTRGIEAAKLGSKFMYSRSTGSIL